jgi:hypothetical protein
MYKDEDVPGLGGKRQGTRRCPQFHGPSGPISTGPPEIRNFSLVYGAEAVLPPEIYLKSAMVAYFNPEDQAEARELDANLLEERRNTTLSNLHKYQAALKRCYDKSVVQRELTIRDLVLKKDIRTKDKHKFLTP